MQEQAREMAAIRYAEPLAVQAEAAVANPSVDKHGKARPTAGRIGAIQSGSAGRIQAPAAPSRAAPAAPGTPVAYPPGQRSGYAADKYPHLVEGDEAAGRVVPRASEHGAQQGRVPPAVRKAVVEYDAVDADEAARRAYARRNGQMERIAGGLDEPGVAKGANPATEQYDDARMEAHDAPSTPVAPVKRAAQQVGPLGHEQLMAVAEVLMAKLKQEPEKAPSEPVVAKSAYLAQRKRISIGMEGGTYSLPAIDIKITDAGIIILLPSGPESVTFIPTAGSSLNIGVGTESYKAYFPGTAFVLEELNALVLTFVRKHDDGKAQRDSD